MNIDYLKTVKAAAELENYQIVSERLSCAVSTVSYQIRKVEEDMGIQIFERAGRNIRLTQQGIRALHLIGNILDSLDALSSLQDPFSVKQLKIAVAEPIFLHRICPKLSYLESLFPNTELSFIIRNCGDVKTHVLSGMSDIGIHFAFDNYDESMNTHILGTCPLIFVGSPSLTSAERDFATPGRHKKIHLIEYMSKSFVQNSINNYLTHKKLKLLNSIYVSDVEAAKICAVNGAGVACVPRIAAEQELESGVLTEMITDGWKEELSIILAFSKHSISLPGISRISEALRDLIGRH